MKTRARPAAPPQGAVQQRYAVMLTRDGNVLIPLRDIPPEQKRTFGIPKPEGKIIDMKAVLK